MTKEKWSFMKQTKRTLVGAALLTMLVGGGIVGSVPFLQSNSTAYALTLPAGNTELGQISGVPVIQSSTNDMASPAFQDLVDSIVSESNPQYVVNETYWGANTQLVGGTPLASMPTGQSFWLKEDGFTNSDNYVTLNKGEPAGITNVGYATDLESGKKIPLNLVVVYQDSQTSNGAGTADKVYLAAKNQGSVVTLGWVAPADAGSENTGGSSEGGGPVGGDGGGDMASYINSVRFSLVLVNADTGQPLPDDKTMMALKISDVDALQKVALGNTGAKGIILSPDTQLAIDGQGMVAKNTGATNEDTKYLSALSYVTLRQFNATNVSFSYTGTEINKHCDMVIGAFGLYPFELNLKGKIAIDKETVQYGKDHWNNLYSFEPITFDVLDNKGTVVDTLTLSKDGKKESIDLPRGEYTLRETSKNWAATGQTKHDDIKVTVEAGKTVTVDVDNTAVQGEITIKKAGVESGTELWNGNYTLQGNEFLLTSKTDGKTYIVTTDAAGVAKSGKLPLGTYKIEEVKASNGFVNTFEAKEVTLSYKDQTTEVVFGETNGTNQEIKGENTLQKADNTTELDQNGKAVLKTAKYQLFYGDDATGSSPHKKNDPVKWTDQPAPKLLAGEKVTEAVIGGTNADFGDNVVIDVDDSTLKAAIGNLPLGKFFWKEVDAGAGYVVDPTEHAFEINKLDDKTDTIITDDTRSEEQVIKAKIKLDKSLTLPEGEGGSGFNNIEFTATPLEGTVAEPVIFKTGINPTTGDDGFAEMELVYGDWVIKETKGVEGFDDVRPIYIRMSTNEETDILTIVASFNEDFSDPFFSGRTFALLDSSTEKNPNAEAASTVGDVTSDSPIISLSTIRLNDNPPKPTEPGIDVEKATVAVPEAGVGNGADKANNVENDFDEKDQPFHATGGKETDVYFRITNTGNEDLTNIKPTDKTIEGTVDITSITWDYETNDQGIILDKEGKPLVLKQGETFTGKGTLPVLPGNELHGDLVTVEAEGVTSKKLVADEDPLYVITPDGPGIDVEKGSGSVPKAGNGNGTDKPNNVENDFDDKNKPFEIAGDKETDLYFRITNTGNEDLTDIKPVDTTTDGSIDLTTITWDYQTNDQGIILDKEGKNPLVLKPGETFTGKGILPALPGGELHGDNLTVEAVGVTSKKPVTDEDPWYGIVPEKPVTFDPTNPSTYLPSTGELISNHPFIFGLMLVTVAGGMYLMKRRFTPVTPVKKGIGRF